MAAARVGGNVMLPENAVDRRFGKGCVAWAEKECQLFREMSDSIRADKWLWAARFFKTRALAGEILGDGKVKRNGHVLKSSSSIQPGDVLEIPFVEGPGLREIVVTKVIDRRVGAPEARACYEERTKPEVFEALKNWQIAKAEAAKGRPTKKDRRAIDKIKEAWEWDT